MKKLKEWKLHIILAIVAVTLIVTVPVLFPNDQGTNTTSCGSK